jgi:hypothetical protein
VHARDELGERERLGQVVVGAQREPVDQVVERPRRREHEHLRVGLLGGERPADVVAVDLGQVAVEHDDVVVGDPRLEQRLGAVGRDVDRDPFAAQAAGDGVRDAALVLGNQYAHVREDGAIGP